VLQEICPAPLPETVPIVPGGSDRDQRVRRRPVAQNAPPAVADDFVSGIVEKSDAVRLEVNPVCTIRLDPRHRRSLRSAKSRLRAGSRTRSASGTSCARPYGASRRNPSGYCNPEIDKLVDRQSAEPNFDNRKTLVWEIEKRLVEDGAPARSSSTRAARPASIRKSRD
jgi:hypothetical protein